MEKVQWCRINLEFIQVVKKYPTGKDPDGPLPCSQKLAFGECHYLIKSDLLTYVLILYGVYNIISPSNPRS
jgi:hypothetical protein